MEEVIDKATPYDQTISLRKILGVRVLSAKSFAVGRVAQLRINADTKTLEGIVVFRGFLRKPLYIGKTYFDKLSSEAIILNIEPSVLLRGRKVITYDGEVAGRVKEVERLAKTNGLKNLVVHSFLRGRFNVSADDIKSIGKSIMLKSNYNVPKKSLWRRV